MLQRSLSVSLAVWLAFLSACQMLHPPVHGIPNFAAVNEHRRIYRGGEPLTLEGWAYIKSRGVRTVVKLNVEKESTDAGAREVGLTVARLPITRQEQMAGSPELGGKIRRAVS